MYDDRILGNGDFVEEILKRSGIYEEEKGVTIGEKLNKSGSSMSILYKRGEGFISKDKESKLLIDNILIF